MDVAGELDVVEADDRHVVRHAAPGLGDGADRAERHQVGGRDHRGRGLGQREETRHRAMPAVDVEVSVGDVLVAVGETEGLHLGAVGTQALGARRRVEQAGDGGDPPVPQLVQMPHGQGDSRLVVGDHELGRGADELDVDADAGQVGADEAADLGVLGVDVHEHDAGDVVMARALEEGVVAVAVAGALAGEQQQVVAAGADGVLEPDEHLVEEGVAERVGVALAGLEEDADQMRALRDEAAGRRCGRVVELLRQADDPLAGVGVDVRVAVQRPGDGADRHAAQAGQLSDCHSLISHRKRFWNCGAQSKHNDQGVVKAPVDFRAVGALPGSAAVTRWPPYSLFRDRRRGWRGGGDDARLGRRVRGGADHRARDGHHARLALDLDRRRRRARGARGHHGAGRLRAAVLAARGAAAARRRLAAADLRAAVAAQGDPARRRAQGAARRGRRLPRGGARPRGPPATSAAWASTGSPSS